MSLFCVSGQSGQSAVKVIFAFTLTTESLFFSVVCASFWAVVKVVKVIFSRIRAHAGAHTRAHAPAQVYIYFDHFDHLIINNKKQIFSHQNMVKVPPFLALTAL